MATAILGLTNDHDEYSALASDWANSVADDLEAVYVGAGWLANNQTWTGQNTFSNATAPIIAAKLGPASGQQHTLPAVSSDTVALLAASQTLTNKTLGASTISGLMTFADAVNVAFNGTTGTKLGTATTQKIGVWNATPVVRPGAYTQTYATADKTLGTYTPDDESAAYTGAADSEAKLADLNALRVAVENLRAFVEDLAQHHNAVLDDLQTIGWLA